MKLNSALIFAWLVASSAIAQDMPEPPDEEKVSYALGMNLGLQIKRMGAEADVSVILQAMKDVMEGKTTQIKESDLRPIFQQEEAAQRAIITKRNKAEGEAFLARNAREPGVKVLPDGLQYRVIQEGTGAIPASTDTVIMNFRGGLINGKEIHRADHLQALVSGQMKACQEALQLMKVGSKWQVFAPPALAFGNEWNGDVGPQSTILFEVELISIEPAARVGNAAGEPVKHLDTQALLPAAGK